LTTTTPLTSTLTLRFPTATSLYFSYFLVDDSTAPPPSVAFFAPPQPSLPPPFCYPYPHINCLIPQQQLQRRCGLLTNRSKYAQVTDLGAFPALSLVLVTAELRPDSNWVETAKANGPIPNSIPASSLRLRCTWCFPELCFSSSN
jgi:hypothetical protein